MAELEMLPAWAGRLAEPTHPPQPPGPPRRNGEGPTSANGHGPTVLTGQPPLPSGDHRLEPIEGDDEEGRPLAAPNTAELPVVSIPFEDETSLELPPTDPPADPPAATIEAPVDDSIVDAELLDEGDERAFAGDPHLDEIVYEPDEIELLEDTDPIGIVPHDDLPGAPVAAADTIRAGSGDRPAERRRPVRRVFSLLLLAVLVVTAGVAAGYLYVFLTGS